MDYISSSLKRFGTQIWHFLLLPVFFLAFVLVYSPFGCRTFIAAGREMFNFNVTMLFCIMLVVLVATRLGFFFIWRRRMITLVGYIGWCLGEIALMSLFFSLYMYLIAGGSNTYFSVLGRCIELVGLTLIYPYGILTMVFLLQAGRESGGVDPESLIRFMDSSKRLKFVIAASAVVYIEAEENYVRIHYVEGTGLKDYVLRNSMKKIEEITASHGLVRSHRSYILNPSHIKVLRRDKEGVIVAEFDVQTPDIPVSKRYYDKLASLLS